MPSSRSRPKKEGSAVVKRRSRRTPEEARALILDAATRTFAVHLPETVGLKDVAREAGVSHALITHYFGTYDALVEAALERRFEQLRAELLPVIMTGLAADASLLDIVAAHRDAIARAARDPATLRLVVWAVLSGRAAASDFFPHRMQGLRVLTDALGTRSKAPRDDIEFLLVASFALATTFAFGGQALAGALGRRSATELRASFDERTDEMFAAFLGRARGDVR